MEIVKTPRTSCLSGVIFCLLGCVGMAGSLAVGLSTAAAQQPADSSVPLPATEPPPASLEELPPGQAPQDGMVSAPQAGGVQSPQPGTPVEAVPAGMSAPVSEGALIGGPELADGQAIPPTASTRDWFDFHCWYTQDDFTLLNHQKDKRNIRLLFDTEDIENQFFTRDLSLGLSPGTRLTVGYILDHDEKHQDHSIEVTYEGPDSWNKLYRINAAEASIFDPPITATVGSLDNALNQFLGGFNGVDTYLIKYQSDLNSLELNYRIRSELGGDQLVYDPDTALWVRRVGNGVTFSYLLGLRDVDLDERINETATRTAEFVGPASGAYNLKVNNNLAGIQFGGELDYQYQRFFAAVRGSIAPSINFANQMSSIQSTDPILGSLPLTLLKADNDGPACISEFRLEGGYELRPNVRVRFTYDFQWLTSIALAPNQLALANPNPGKLIVSNDIMLNGVSVGIDVSW